MELVIPSVGNTIIVLDYPKGNIYEQETMRCVVRIAFLIPKGLWEAVTCTLLCSFWVGEQITWLGRANRDGKN